MKDPALTVYQSVDPRGFVVEETIVVRRAVTVESMDANFSLAEGRRRYGLWPSGAYRVGYPKKNSTSGEVS